MKDWTGASRSVWSTNGASNHAAGEREPNDYYATDPAAIDKLLAAERPHPFIWECAAGGGHHIPASGDVKERIGAMTSAGNPRKRE